MLNIQEEKKLNLLYYNIMKQSIVLLLDSTQLLYIILLSCWKCMMTQQVYTLQFTSS